MAEKHADIELLTEKARQIRVNIIKALANAKSGHTGGSLGMTDVYAVLYFHEMNHRPKEPEWEDRDRLILSAGHIIPVRYAAMAESGYFPKKELLTLRKFGWELMHMCMFRLPEKS